VSDGKTWTDVTTGTVTAIEKRGGNLVSLKDKFN
jgi:hypothetical protein